MAPTRRELAVLAAVHVAVGFLVLAPSYVRPDSVAIYSWLRSLLVDGDLLFFNEWAGFRMIGDGFAYFKEVTPVKALANHWWVGTSILVAPFYAAARALSPVLAAEASAADGFFGLELATLAWASVLFHALAMVAAWQAFGRLARERQRASLVVPTLLGASLGTTLFWQVFRMPLGTHAAGAFLVGLLTLLSVRVLQPLRTGEEGCAPAADAQANPPSWPVLVGVGIVFGLAVVTRLQHLVLAPALAYLVLRCRPRARAFLWVSAGALIPLLVQGAAWLAVYGTPLGPLQSGANLEGVTWMPFRSFAFGPVLGSPWRGLFVWSPIWILALAGLLLLARDRSSSLRRDLGVLCLLMFAGELFANATLDRFWWGGSSLGGRRFVDLAVPAAIGLWSLLKRTRRAGQLVVALATAWSCALMLAVHAGTLDLGRYLGWKELLSGLAIRGLALDALHSPLTSPALAAQSTLAILLIAALTSLVVLLVRKRPVAAALLSGAWILACLVAVLAAIGPTRGRAAAELSRFGLTGEAARAVGPLLDQRNLIADELDWLEATGRSARAARTRDEIARIDRELDRLGIRLNPD